MEYQKIINLLDNTPNQPSRFWTKKCVEINDNTRGQYNTISQINFKTSMLNSSLSDYSVAYILVQGTIIIAPELTLAANSDNNDKEVVFKDCVLFTDCISKINNIQIGNAKDIDVVMPINNLIEYRDNYSKASGSL